MVLIEKENSENILDDLKSGNKILNGNLKIYKLYEVKRLIQRLDSAK